MELKVICHIRFYPLPITYYSLLITVLSESRIKRIKWLPWF